MCMYTSMVYLWEWSWRYQPASNLRRWNSNTFANDSFLFRYTTWYDPVRLTIIYKLGKHIIPKFDSNKLSYIIFGPSRGTRIDVGTYAFHSVDHRAVAYYSAAVISEDFPAVSLSRGRSRLTIVNFTNFTLWSKNQIFSFNIKRNTIAGHTYIIYIYICTKNDTVNRRLS